MFRKSLFFLLSFLFTSGLFANSKDCSKIDYLLYIINTFHVNAHPIDSALNEEILNNFIDDVDPYRVVFTQSEVEQLKSHLRKWNTPERNCSFFGIATGYILKAFHYSDSVTRTLYDYKFNLEQKNVFLDANDEFAKDRKTLDLRIKHNVCLNIIDAMYSDVEDNTKAAIAAIALKEPEYRKKIIDRSLCEFEGVLKKGVSFERDVESLFLNTVIQIYDPHSMYFTPEIENEFMSMLSKEVLSFGLEFDQRANGEIYVLYSVPGGPAWKSNQINEEDVLLRIQTPEGTVHEFNCVNLQVVYELMVNNKTLTFTLKELDGEEFEVTLTKENISVEENRINSFLLNGNSKLGYIYLPGFYTDWDGSQVNGCANDFAKEITKLKQDNVEGIILDLRDNGGGSMTEALQLAGIFINEGPLCMEWDKKTKPSIMKDPNRGVLYDGPLCVLINGYSASASELICAALKDYNRAIIVGDYSYGKATSQIILPLDTSLIAKAAYAEVESPLGYVKVTTGKFYGLKGQTHQGQGVKPDVQLTYAVGMKEERESTNAQYLKADSVYKKVVYTPFSPLPTDILKTKSEERVAKDSNFSAINHLNDVFKNHKRFNYKYPLNVYDFCRHCFELDSLLDELEALAIKETSEYTVTNNSFDTPIVNLTSISRDANDQLIELIKSDIYIEEAFRIMRDYISIK